MIKNLKVVPGTIESERLLFEKVEGFRKINILFGGNGAGKSTFLNGLREEAFDLDISRNIEILSFVNSSDNLSHGVRSLDGLSPIDTSMIYDATSFSEGQGMVFYLNRFIKKIRDYVSFNPDKTIIVLIDEMDSGMSSENINMFLHLICEIVNDYDNIQFFISTNHYHYVYVFKDVISMYTGEWTRIDSYDEFFQLLNKGIKIMADSGRDFSFLNTY